MERFAAGGDVAVSTALDALATRLGLGLLLIDSNGHPFFSNRTALELLACRDSAALPGRWLALQSVMNRDASVADAAEPGTFTADLPVEGTTRFLRGELRTASGGFEVLLKDRRVLGPFDLELLCAARMREWTHQSEALVHDANGALNTIQLTLELLNGQWPGEKAGEQAREPHQRDHVAVIRENLDKLKGVLRHMAGANESTPAPGALDLRDVVRQAAYTLRVPARRRHVDLQSRIGGAELRLDGNLVQIRQALVNLALGRLEGLAERGSLVLEAGSSDEGLEIVCSDDGPLPEPARAGMFRILPAESGAGARPDALRLARAIVECDGGECQVRNSAGAGTALRFLFPRSRA